MFVFCILFAGHASAQDTRNVETPASPNVRYKSVKSERKGFFSFLKKKERAGVRTNEEELAAFRKRVSEAYRENAKAEYKAHKVKRKEARSGEKFHGHKRPPKKRPPGKQKFCKICRIKH